MAETVEYIVRVKGLTESSEKSEDEKTSQKPSGFKKLQKAIHPLKHSKDEGFVTYYGKEVAKNAISLGHQVVTLSVNRYFQLSEDYKGENYLNNVMGNINRVKSIGSSIVGGAMAGSTFGPLGIVVGAAVSGATTVIRQQIDFKNKVASFEQSLNATRVETAFRAQRAGLYDGGKGTEN